MKLQFLAFVLLFAGALAESTTREARHLQTIGPEDVAAASAVGEAVVMTGITAKKAAAEIAHAKAREAYIDYKADRKVAKAMQHAMRHSGAHIAETAALGQAAALPGLGGVAVAGAVLSGLESAKISAHDNKRIARAVAKASHMKAKAKAHTVKVVVAAVGEAASTDLAYGAKAALAVGNAALHDAATFAPVLAGLAPTFLPQLAGLAAQGPEGLLKTLGGLAQSIGGALLGNSAIGVAGPTLLANRVAGLLPEDLLTSLALPGLPNPLGAATTAAGGLENIIQNLPPQALETIVNFLSGGNPGAASGLINLPASGRDTDSIMVPPNALEAILHSITNLMNNNRDRRGGPHIGPIQLPRLPLGGLPMPLRMVSNLLGVLPRPDLSGIFRLLPRNPLLGLINGLPLGLMEDN